MLSVNRSCNDALLRILRRRPGACMHASYTGANRAAGWVAGWLHASGWRSRCLPRLHQQAAAYTLLIGTQEVSYTSIGTSRSIVPPHFALQSTFRTAECSSYILGIRRHPLYYSGAFARLHVCVSQCNLASHKGACMKGHILHGSIKYHHINYIQR